MAEMVKLSFSYIEKIENKEEMLAHVKTIKQVCDKKIFLEVIILCVSNNFQVEYARCALILVKENETSDNIKAAAALLQDI